jgi:hypothetical protein
MRPVLSPSSPSLATYGLITAWTVDRSGNMLHRFRRSSWPSVLSNGLCLSDIVQAEVICSCWFLDAQVGRILKKFEIGASINLHLVGAIHSLLIPPEVAIQQRSPRTHQTRLTSRVAHYASSTIIAANLGESECLGCLSGDTEHGSGGLGNCSRAQAVTHARVLERAFCTYPSPSLDYQTPSLIPYVSAELTLLSQEEAVETPRAGRYWQAGMNSCLFGSEDYCTGHA